MSAIQVRAGRRERIELTIIGTFQIRTVKSTQLPPTPSTIATAPGSGIPVPSATVPRPVSAVASAGTPTTAGTR